MLTIVTISGADKSGALARILGLLARQGHVLKGQQFSGSAEGARLLRIKVEARQLVKDRLAADLKALNPEYGLVSVAFEGEAAGGERREGQDQTGAALIREMALQFPRILPLVQAYGGSFGAEARGEALFEAGGKIGGYHYTKDWSLGSPLKMPAALRRALVPALETFGAVEATDNSVILPDSPFCAGRCCEFVTGFMQGFLAAGPATKDVRVQRTACKAAGDEHCSYRVD